MSDWKPLRAGIEIMATGSVRDNKTLSRFELDAEGGLAFANYRLTPSAVIITHTETGACAATASPRIWLTVRCN
jgi:hypothetical protein